MFVLASERSTDVRALRGVSELTNMLAASRFSLDYVQFQGNDQVGLKFMLFAELVADNKLGILGLCDVRAQCTARPELHVCAIRR